MSEFSPSTWFCVFLYMLSWDFMSSNSASSWVISPLCSSWISSICFSCLACCFVFLFVKSRWDLPFEAINWMWVSRHTGKMGWVLEIFAISGTAVTVSCCFSIMWSSLWCSFCWMKSWNFSFIRVLTKDTSNYSKTGTQISESNFIDHLLVFIVRQV